MEQQVLLWNFKLLCQLYQKTIVQNCSADWAQFIPLHRMIIKTSLKSNFSDMAATDFPCLLKGSPFQVTHRRQAFISLDFQIIFPMPDNPIKAYSSHFSFLTQAKVLLFVKEYVSKMPVHLILWEMTTGRKANILHREKKALWMF